MGKIRSEGDYLLLGKIDRQEVQSSITLNEALRTRRSCRAYSDTPVERQVLCEILQLSMNAASACNEQQWHFINIDDKEILKDLFYRGSAAFLTKTNQAVLVLYDNSTINKKYADHMQSGASFISYFMLVAHSFGVGTCWVCHLPRKAELRRLFGVPVDLDPVALVTYGYYRGRIKHRQIKFGVEERLHSNMFSSVSARPSRKQFIKRVLMEVYYWLPPILRKVLRRHSFPYEKKFYNHKG